jgi:hypothetical protein
MSQNIPVYAMETSTIIDAPSNLVWEVLIDTHCWSRWGPSVNAVRCRDRFIQSGSKGYVRVMNIRATGHRVEYLAIKQCRLIFEVPWLAAPYLLICKIAARRIKLIAESY